MQYEFKMGAMATKATENIRFVYGNDALSAEKCQR